VIIDNWTEHVNMIMAKADSIRGFLQCNLSKCPARVKKSSYTTHVRPILDSILSPYQQHNIQKIEMIQRRAAHFVTSNYDWNASVTSTYAATPTVGVLTNQTK